MEAKQTPLIELLERVPKDARLVVEHNQFSSSSHPVGRLCHEAAAALREALAEQPAQQQEQDQTEIAFEAWWQAHGQFHRSGGGDYEKTFAWHAWLASLACTEQPARQEPVAWLHPANATCVTTDPTAYARGIPLYTSPQPSKPWVGLTEEDWIEMGCKTVEEMRIATAIQNKLREKNA